ncbi:STAS domain-containing protein [Frankia sp. QA3]|uniref:STAS domain-containing protein n=1 Tax=Frankia sp. QA3 TaxID=710111 RepID=UPI000269CB41|nr:STAS domain-containing protein [Frankia sp. QA3]EIV95296.1 STAS domain-containing protein [Frankia sp. QA3]
MRALDPAGPAAIRSGVREAGVSEAGVSEAGVSGPGVLGPGVQAPAAGEVRVRIAGSGRLAAVVRPRPGGFTVAFQGDLDTAAEQMARALLWACLDGCASALIVDLTGVFVDVRGFTALHLLWRAGRERGIRVALTGCSQVVDRMATILTPQGIPRFRTVDAAWQAVTGSESTAPASAATAG